MLFRDQMTTMCLIIGCAITNGLMSTTATAQDAVTQTDIAARSEGDSNLIRRWTFEEGDTEGWQPITQVELSTHNGLLHAQGTGQDPHMISEVSGPAGWYRLSLRARFERICNVQVFWTDAEHDKTSESRSVSSKLTSKSADRFDDYHIYFKAEAPLTRVRIDTGNRPALIEFDEIALFAERPPVDSATDPATFDVLPGFQVELLYSVPSFEEGSWVSTCCDPSGRLYVCDQYGGLYRITPSSVVAGLADSVSEQGSVDHDGTSAPETMVEPVPVKIDGKPFGGAQGMVWHRDGLYAVVNSHLALGAGLYRLTDSDDNDELDTVALIMSLPTTRVGVEHGPHGVVVGPEGDWLYLVAGNMTSPPQELAVSRSLHWAEDQLLPRLPASNGHATNLMAPGGWVARVRPDGSDWELICTGFRNPYDIAFNRDGELFTYDADMEMDIGTPWYRPTRVCHVVSGGDFGWRFGTGKWPTEYLDTLPPVVDVGLGSPTGVVFGHGAQFPKRYQDAFYICDWTHGRMFAVHLSPDGASYTGELEEFLSATPLPLTDVVINPVDRAMYFTIGGRRTQSGLYRVTYDGDQRSAEGDAAPISAVSDSEPIPFGPPGSDGDPYHEILRLHRRAIEDVHANPDSTAELYLFDELRSSDRHVRHAARVALEHIPVDVWKDRALSGGTPPIALAALTALIRTVSVESEPALKAEVANILARFDLEKLPRSLQLDFVRVVQLLIIRHGQPDGEKWGQIINRSRQLFPSDDPALNRELCRLLIAVDESKATPIAMQLAEREVTQETRLFYLMALRNARSGWTPELRRMYFEYLNEAETKAATGEYSGGGHLQTYIRMFRADAAARLSEDEQAALADVIEAELPSTIPTGSPTPRKFVRNWTEEDLVDSLPEVSAGRSFENGRLMFTEAQCIRCHRFGNSGGIFGPDITQASKRYSRAVMLRELITPSKQISDQYQAHQFLMDDGRVHTGRILNEDDDSVTVATDPLRPAHVVVLAADEIEERRVSPESLMPAGLLNTLERNDILDLMAYMESGGDPDHSAFQAGRPVSHSFITVDSSQKRLAWIAEDGMTQWEYEVGPVHDLQLLANGHLLFQTSWTRLVEVNPETNEVVWEYDASTANGNSGRPVEVHAFQRLDDGVTMIAESGPARIIEVDRDGTLLHTVPLHVHNSNPHHDTRLVRKLDSGNYLVCHESDGAVREYNSEGRIIWEYEVPLFGKDPKPGHGPDAFGNQCFSALRLDNENTLIATGNGHSVIEVDPKGEVVWKLDQDEVDGVRLAWVTTLQVLANGNIVIGNCHAGPNQPQVIEITRDKQLVWSFRDFERFGNSLTNTYVIDE